MGAADNFVVDYRCQTEVGRSDVQRNLDPRGLFTPHNNLSELLASFSFQLRYAETLGTSGLEEGAMIPQAYISGSRAAGLTNSLSSARDEQYLWVDDHSP